MSTLVNHSAKSQCALILKHIKRHKSIGFFTALNRYKCARLASRINDLRKEGHKIITVWQTSKDGKRFAVYKMG